MFGNHLLHPECGLGIVMVRWAGGGGAGPKDPPARAASGPRLSASGRSQAHGNTSGRTETDGSGPGRGLLGGATSRVKMAKVRTRTAKSQNGSGPGRGLRGCDFAGDVTPLVEANTQGYNDFAWVQRRTVASGYNRRGSRLPMRRGDSKRDPVPAGRSRPRRLGFKSKL